MDPKIRKGRMINFYLKCHGCGGVQFTVLAITNSLKKAYFNVVCVHCGHESTIDIEDNKHVARESEV